MVPSIARDATRGEFSTGVLWQDEKGPRVGLTALRRPEEVSRLKRIEVLVTFAWYH